MLSAILFFSFLFLQIDISIYHRGGHLFFQEIFRIHPLSFSTF